MLTVAVLGPVEVRRDGEKVPLPSGRTTQVLVRLALEAGRPVGAGTLLRDLWEDAGVSTGKNTVQSKVSQLRRALGQPGLVTGSRGAYALDIDPDCVDALRVVSLARDATTLRRAGDVAAALEVSSQGLAMFRGEVLGDAGDAPWLHPHRARLEELRIGLWEDHLAARVQRGAGGDVIGELEGLVQRYPLREGLWFWLITALYRDGRQADALAAYATVRRTLVDELGLEPGRDLQQLEEQVLQHSSALAGVSHHGGPLTVPPTPGNLPGLSAPLIGRDTDLDAVHRHVDQRRLVTLVGTPGVGKTRLAIEAARLVRVPGGVWFVRLDALDAAADIVQAVAETLDLSGEQALFERITGSETLFVFDNCEHVVEQVSRLITRLLDATTQVRVLATSQLPLGLDGETVYPVTPLPMTDSVRLFADRAVAARPQWELDAGAAMVVSEICGALDGLPLAIELAAARMKSLSAQEIARRLEHRFALLQDPTSRRPERRRALAAAIAWSHDLLSAEERRALWALSCFAGGAPLDAAERVLGVLDIPAAVTDDVIGRLVDRSLVQLDVTGQGEVRYRLLDAIRVFALDRLDESGWAEAARTAHAEWIADAADGCAATVRGPGQPRCLAFVRQERANTEAALAWTARHRPAVGVRIVNGFGWTWVVIGDGVAGAARIRVALAAATSVVSDRDRAVALLLAGWLEASAGNLDRAESELAEARRLAEHLAAADLEADAARHLAFLHLQQRRPDLARTRSHQSSDIDRPLGRTWELAAGLVLAASASLMLGETSVARGAADEALLLLEPLGDAWGLVHGQAILGAIARAEGRFEQAARYLDRAAATSRRRGFRGQAAYHLTALGEVQHRAGDLRAAGETLLRAIEAAHQDGDFRMAATATTHLARVRAAAGSPDEALCLLQETDQWYRRSGGGQGALLTRALLLTMSPPAPHGDARRQLASVLDQARRDQDHEVEAIALDALARLPADTERVPDVVQALQALVDGDRIAALDVLRGDRSLVGQALAEFVATERGGGSVYDQPAAFAAFIRGGGNVGLYSATSAALADLYDRYRPESLLDIGCGDGAALLPALALAAHPVRRIEVVEPSAALLAQATVALQRLPDVEVATSARPVQQFVAENPGFHVDLAQSTFALHALPTDERTEVLRSLRDRVTRIALVEFDVPDLAPRSAAYLEFLARTYERGLAEYTDDRDLVAQGFLMPVLVGQLAPGAVRSTWEQPASAWRAQVAAAGFFDVVVRPVFDYWSSPAFLLTARGAAH